MILQLNGYTVLPPTPTRRVKLSEVEAKAAKARRIANQLKRNKQIRANAMKEERVSK